MNNRQYSSKKGDNVRFLDEACNRGIFYERQCRDENGVWQVTNAKSQLSRQINSGSEDRRKAGWRYPNCPNARHLNRKPIHTASGYKAGYEVTIPNDIPAKKRPWMLWAAMWPHHRHDLAIHGHISRQHPLGWPRSKNQNMYLSKNSGDGRLKFETFRERQSDAIAL